MPGSQQSHPASCAWSRPLAFLHMPLHMPHQHPECRHSGKLCRKQRETCLSLLEFSRVFAQAIPDLTQFVKTTPTKSLSPKCLASSGHHWTLRSMPFSQPSAQDDVRQNPVIGYLNSLLSSPTARRTRMDHITPTTGKRDTPTGLVHVSRRRILASSRMRSSGTVDCARFRAKSADSPLQTIAS